MYKKICAYSKWDDTGVIIAGGLSEKDDIAGRDELEQARKLGIEI